MTVTSRSLQKSHTLSLPERSLVFAAYEAALDQEEAACKAYATQIRLVTRVVP